MRPELEAIDKAIHNRNRSLLYTMGRVVQMIETHFGKVGSFKHEGVAEFVLDIDKDIDIMCGLSENGWGGIKVRVREGRERLGKGTLVELVAKRVIFLPDTNNADTFRPVWQSTMTLSGNVPREVPRDWLDLFVNICEYLDHARVYSIGMEEVKDGNNAQEAAGEPG